MTKEVEAFDIETYTTPNLTMTRKALIDYCKSGYDVVNVCAMCYTKGDEDIYVLGIDDKDRKEFLLEMPEGVYGTWNGARFDNHAVIHLLHKYGIPYEYMYQSKSSMLSLTFQSRYGKVQFKDFCKIFHGSLASLLKELVPDMPKLEGYDYSLLRDTADKFSENDIAYVKADVRGLKVAISKLSSAVEQLGIPISKTWTAGALATKFMRNELKSKGLSTEDLFINSGIIDYTFISGGIVEVNPMNKFRAIENVHHYDIVSFYPYTMSKELPYGDYVEDGETEAKDFLEMLAKDTDHLYFAKTKCNGSYRGTLSPIFGKDKMGVNSSLKAWTKDEMISISDPVLRSHRIRLFNGTVVWQKYKKMKYLSSTMKNIFDKKKMYKEKGEHANALVYKIIANALSGKFMQKPNDTEYEFIFNDDVIESSNGDDTKPWHVYLPVGAILTAYAREYICDIADTLGHDFIYTDTDSVFFKEGGLEKIKDKYAIGEELGELSEKDFAIYDKGAFLGKKCYLTIKGDKKKSVIAGIRGYTFDTIEEAMRDLRMGQKTLTLQAYRTPQGIVLHDTLKGKNFKELHVTPTDIIDKLRIKVDTGDEKRLSTM